MATVTIRRPTPLTVSMWQFRAELKQRSLLAAFDHLVATLPDRYKIIWDRSEIVRRDAPALTGMLASLRWSSEYLDGLFVAASRHKLTDEIS